MVPVFAAELLNGRRKLRSRCSTENWAPVAVMTTINAHGNMPMGDSRRRNLDRWWQAPHPLPTTPIAYAWSRNH